MMLELQSRLCGNVHVVECKGRIVAGEEIAALDSAVFHDARRDSNLLVLQVGEVTRMDSSGLGFLVRCALNLRKRGGDMRLAVPPPFLNSLLNLTKVASILESFPTEEEAILSFLKQTAAVAPASNRGSRVLVIDPSGDLCAFVRAVLSQHGFDVESTSLARDAGILLQVVKFEQVLVGPGTPQLAPGSITAALQAIAPRSRVVQLGPEFKSCDAHECAGILLQVVRQHSPAGRAEMRQ